MLLEHGVGPLLRTCTEGEGQHVQGGLLECAVLEFGGRALSEGVWVSFRPSSLEGVSKCRARALGGGVGVGFGFCAAGGRLRGQKIRPRSPTGFPVPKWTGKALALYPSIPLCPPHHLPQGLPCPCWTPNHRWVPLGVEIGRASCRERV